MERRFLRTPARVLRKIARSPSTSIAVLQEILVELGQRKNPYAFQIYLEVGRLIEQAQDKEILQVEERRRAEVQRVARRNLDGFFEWPSTDAPASVHGFIGDVFFYKDGLLSYVGYQVGRDAVPTRVRLQILDCVFHNVLPRVQSPLYMEEWGMPKTAGRLHKLADAIASFTRNAKRNKTFDYSKAISDWEYDLAYLFRKYYVNRFHFAWPNPDDIE